MFDPAEPLLATPHTQASIMQIKAARHSMATQELNFPIMRVTVSIGKFVKLMYCDGAQPDQEKPVAVMVPDPILQAVLLKTPPSDKPMGSGLTICPVSVIICLGLKFDFLNLM